MPLTLAGLPAEIQEMIIKSLIDDTSNSRTFKHGSYRLLGVLQSLLVSETIPLARFQYPLLKALQERREELLHWKMIECTQPYLEPLAEITMSPVFEQDPPLGPPHDEAAYLRRVRETAGRSSPVLYACLRVKAVEASWSQVLAAVLKVSEMVHLIGGKFDIVDRKQLIAPRMPFSLNVGIEPAAGLGE